jgi:hypothetical protein
MDSLESDIMSVKVVEGIMRGGGIGPMTLINNLNTIRKPCYCRNYSLTTFVQINYHVHRIVEKRRERELMSALKT